MKSSDFIKRTVKPLERIMSMGYSQHDVFNDFVGLIFYAFQRYLKIR